MKTLQLYIAIGIGGVIGSVLRFLVSLAFEFNSNQLFPWETLVVNLTGTFLLAFILFSKVFREKWHPVIFTAIASGLIGSFTTLSAVTFEIFTLWEEHVLVAVIYCCASIFGGLYVSFLGYKLAVHRERQAN